MSGTLRITILGCGSSGGVPRASGDWGKCDPNEPKNRRTRGGALLEKWSTSEAGARADATVALIDTPPDLRQQLMRDPPEHLDAVVFSHDHADQTHGIDDVRAYFLKRRAAIPAYLDALTRERLETRFGYCFTSSPGYPAILNVAGELIDRTPTRLNGAGGALEIIPLAQDHGFTTSLGFRVGGLAYSNDVVSLPEQSFEALRGLELWIVDALREAPHPSHAHIDRALEWIEELKPKHAVLTNLNHDVDYARLRARLPQGVEPAYDGWRADVAL